MRNHTAFSPDYRTLYGMLTSQNNPVLGLPFLIAEFGIHSFHQLRAFQKVVCNNQEPTGKRKGNLVTTYSETCMSLPTL